MNERNEDMKEKSEKAEYDDGDIPGALSDEQEESGQLLERLKRLNVSFKKVPTRETVSF